MTGKRFFAWVWRVNALIVLVVGLAGLALVAVAIVSELRRTRYVSDVVNVAEDQRGKSTASIGSFSEVDGTGILRASLNLNQEYAFGSGSKEANSTRNYLYFNPTSQESYWLIPGYRGLITEENDFPAHECGETSAPPRVVVYELVDTDSNNDDRLTDDDVKSIAVADASGKNFARVLSNVEAYQGGRISATHLVILYKSGGALHAAEIDLASNKVSRDTLLQPEPVEAPLGASAL